MARLNYVQFKFSVIVQLLVSLTTSGAQSLPHKVPEACKANYVFVTCIFSYVHDINTFTELEDSAFEYLTVYFKADIFHGVLPNDIFVRMPNLKSIDFFGYYPRNISERAFAGLKHLEWIGIGRVAANPFNGEKVSRLPLADAPPLVFSPGWHRYTPNVTDLDIAYNNIKSFPTGYFCRLKYLQVLHLSDNKLRFPEDIGITNTKSSAQDHSCLPWLTNLDLSRNHLVSLKGTMGSLGNLVDLQVQYNGLEGVHDVCDLRRDPHGRTPSPCLPSLLNLDLSYNYITVLQGVRPCGNSKLELFSVRSNRLREISSDFFDCNRNLKELDLSGNVLTRDSLLKAGLNDLDKLQFLNLSGNPIRALQPSMISNMGKLTKFICSNCSLHEITKDVFINTVKLSTVILKSNSIRFISKRSFLHLKNLQTLDLSTNKIQVFVTAKALPSLVHLDISGNFLPRIPNFTGNWSNLSHLDLSRNDIKQIEPKRLVGLSQLKSLKLAFNHINCVSFGAFSTVTNLEILDMEKNGILSISNSTISKLTKLTYLNLAQNRIKTVAHWLTYRWSSVNLLHLNLSDNSLREFSSEYVPYTLETIDLSRNLISKIQSTQTLPELLSLNLTYNNLTTLTPYAFEMLSRKDQLSRKQPKPEVLIRGNKLHCDCHVDWLREINTAGNGVWPIVTDLERVRCQTPKANQNRPLSSLTSQDFLCPYTGCDEETCDCCKQKDMCPCYTFCLKGCTCLKGIEKSKVDIMNCTSRNVSSLSYEVGLFSSAIAIHLDGNNLTDLKSSNFNFPRVKKLFLNKSHVTTIKVGVDDKLKTIRELYLQDNDIAEISRLSLHNLPQLDSLYLHNNDIQSIEMGSFDQFYVPKTLWLHNNRLKHIDTRIIDNFKSLKNLTLHGNPWQCDCKSGPLFQKWLRNKSKIISNIERITCRFRTRDHTILDIDFSLCRTNWKVKGLTLLAFALVTIGCMITLIYRKRLLLKILLYNRCGSSFRRKSDKDSTKQYDVFIAHAEEDEDFVLDNFLSELEERDRPLKVCLEMRDCLAGTVITEFIVSAIQNSKMTVLIVSENYFNSKLAQYMFQVAHYQVLADRQLRLIPVLVGQNLDSKMSSDLKLYIQSRTYLKYEDRNFWPRLRYYIGDNGSTPAGESIA